MILEIFGTNNLGIPNGSKNCVYLLDSSNKQRYHGTYKYTEALVSLKIHINYTRYIASTDL